MNLNNDVVYRRRRLGPLHQRHPGRSRSLVRHHDRLHLGTSLYQSSSVLARAASTVHQFAFVELLTHDRTAGTEQRGFSDHPSTPTPARAIAGDSWT
jgi:hypothetical protein